MLHFHHHVQLFLSQLIDDLDALRVLLNHELHGEGVAPEQLDQILNRLLTLFFLRHSSLFTFRLLNVGQQLVLGLEALLFIDALAAEV